MTPRTQKWLIIGGFVWLLAMIALIPLFRAGRRETKNLNEVFEEYSNSLVSRHFDAAYAHAGSDFRGTTSYENFIDTFESLDQEYGPLQSIKRRTFQLIGSGNLRNWHAIIDTELNYKRKTLMFEMVFNKENGRWVLFSIREI